MVSKVGMPVGTYNVTPVRVGLRLYMYKLQVACVKLPVKLQVALSITYLQRYSIYQIYFS